MMNVVKRRKILVLHGNRQTGELLLGRMAKLTRKLCPKKATSNAERAKGVDHPKHIFGVQTNQYELIAPDAPFLFEGDEHSGGDAPVRTWWRRDVNELVGLEDSMSMLHHIWAGELYSEDEFEGIIGFSQGARLAHLMAHLHSVTKGQMFPGMKFVIIASGYDAPLPTNFSSPNETLAQILGSVRTSETEREFSCEIKINIPSLHIIGSKDELVTPDKSLHLMSKYVNPVLHEHEGGHHVPMKSRDVEMYLKFIARHGSKVPSSGSSSEPSPANSTSNPKSGSNLDLAGPKGKGESVPETPDEEHATEHVNECEAISLIYPEEFTLLSKLKPNFGIDDVTNKYEHPIEYEVLLHDPLRNPSDVDDSLWPCQKISLRIRYPSKYPDVSPHFSLSHRMNMLEFNVAADRACMEAVRAAAKTEIGMPCVMNCVLAAKDFFENGGLNLAQSFNGTPETTSEYSDRDMLPSDGQCRERVIFGARVGSNRMKCCDAEGQMVAASILNVSSASEMRKSFIGFDAIEDHSVGALSEGGSSWKYTIGLVGKPSAGKSTFFNAASAFARQRNADGEAGFGAAMAPHPFTTIDPNVGFCFVPAPQGSCPEDKLRKGEADRIGCTHGRDSRGRRLLPVTLKDVAGLVPGAYQGRGRGNKFLDDLTDADVLIHVVDVSGTADAEGNYVGEDGAIHPLQDLEWVRNELIQWVSSNLESKWDGISRKGRRKLVDMFSGYKQSQAFVWSVLLQVERFMRDKCERNDDSLDHLDEWDGGDLRRLVSAFLGVRFPMALALNKSDLPSTERFVSDILQALPAHGAHVGVPLCALSEMKFVQAHVINSPPEKPAADNQSVYGRKSEGISPPEKVWSCLQAAIALREPVLVFPVADMTTYNPLPGMSTYATMDASLPNSGMINCLESSGGVAPSMWDREKHMYYVSDATKADDERSCCPLRDCIMMKPGSTVGDVFNALKGLGALRGEFVRAEGSGNIGEKSKPIPKHEKMESTNRIIKIMTNKRR